MQRPSPWLMLVVLLLGILFLREPRLQRSEDFFLRWLLRNSQPPGPAVPLTVVEIGRDALLEATGGGEASAGSQPSPGGDAISPLEFALFLQSVLEFQPGVVAFENILRWRESDKAQEQVFIDQAMRVPKLLLAADLSATPEPDAPGPEMAGFPHVIGRRGDLPNFSGIGRQPGEELRLISIAGFINLPAAGGEDFRVPLLFSYRGEVIPSFALQAIMIWQRVTPAEVRILLGSHILLSKNRKIPIDAEGTLLIHPEVAKKARRISLNELLLAAQQREAGGPAALALQNIRDEIVLARTPANPLSPPEVFAAAIATMQGDVYLRRISWLFDCAVLLIVTALSGPARKLSRVDLALCGIAVTAAYCLIALALVSRTLLWLPGCLPLGAVWIVILIALFLPRKYAADRPEMMAVPPPVA